MRVFCIPGFMLPAPPAWREIGHYQVFQIARSNRGNTNRGNTMTLKTRITDDMKSAMRARDTARLSAIRLLIAAIRQKEIDERIELDDAQTLSVLEKLVKQRNDSIAQYDAAGRDDLAAVERAEIEVLAAYMPAAASADEVAAAVAEAIAVTGATGMRDMGRVMARLRETLAGRTDMGSLSTQVKKALG